MEDAEILRVVTEVRRACREADGQDPLDEAADLRLRHRGLADLDAFLAGRDGFALRHDTALDLAVAPGARGRGLGTDLAERAVPRSGPLTAWSHGDHPAASRLAARHGLARVRELWVMRRPAGEPLPTAEAPADVRIRGYRPGDEEQLIAVNGAAFADHPEQGAMDRADLERRMAEPWWDPEGLLVAEDGSGRMLGFHWTKRHDARTGEVYVIAVAPEGQGRGLGRLLTLAGLRHLAERGVSEVHLYVEADNEVGVGLYSGLGFVHDARDSHVQYRRTG